jgi:hypothetical protein
MPVIRPFGSLIVRPKPEQARILAMSVIAETGNADYDATV